MSDALRDKEFKWIADGSKIKIKVIDNTIIQIQMLEMRLVKQKQLLARASNSL